MILIDSSFWNSVGVVSSDGNTNGNQYGFYNSIEMSNATTVYNQYEFFKNSPVDGVYYDNQFDWYKAIGVLHSEPIYDQKSFFDNVTLDGVNPVSNQYEFFKGLKDPLDLMFTISSSFNFDKTNNYLTIPNSDIDPNIFGGTNNKYTFYLMIKRNTIGGSQYVFSNFVGANSFLFWINGDNKVSVITNNGAQTLRGTQQLTSTSTWYFIACSIDLETTSNCKITINDVEDTIELNTLTDTTGVATGAYDFGRRSNNTNFLDGKVPYFAVIDRVTTTGENTAIYNSGQPISAEDYFTTECAWFMNADNSGATAPFSIVDSANSVTATSVGMVDADKTTETPY